MSDLHNVERALTAAQFPEWVDHVNAEPMFDHTGEPALRVTVVVRDDRDAMLEDGAALNELSRHLLGLLQGVGVELFPYTRFITTADVA